MSRELLKRALEVIDQAEIYSENENKALALYQAIETYLAQPDFFVSRHKQTNVLSDCQKEWNGNHQWSAAIACYTTPPDQSARIAELKAALQLAKDMMIANDLSLPRTFEVIDEALAKAKGEV